MQSNFNYCLLDQCIQITITLSLSLSPSLSVSLLRIDANFVIKVADFGLAESIGVKEYFHQDEDSPVRLPLKWLALESITDNIFTEKTDVVSCDILCYSSVFEFLHFLVGIWSDLLGDL